MTSYISTKRMVVLATMMAAIIGLGSAAAAEWRRFDSSAFQKAKASGQTVVLDFYANWCPTCQKQKPVLEELLRDEEFRNVTAFTVDYDNSDDLKKELRVSKQSTIVVFKGNSEVARATGTTDAQQLRGLLRKGL